MSNTQEDWDFNALLQKFENAPAPVPPSPEPAPVEEKILPPLALAMQMKQTLLNYTSDQAAEIIRKVAADMQDEFEIRGKSFPDENDYHMRAWDRILMI